MQDTVMQQTAQRIQVRDPEIRGFEVHAAPASPTCRPASAAQDGQKDGHCVGLQRGRRHDDAWQPCRGALSSEATTRRAPRSQDLEANAKQLDARCSELRETSIGHEHRAKEAAAELAKSGQSVDRLASDLQVAREKLKRKQAIIVRQVRAVHACWLSAHAR